jgi:hypothetical protein
MDIIILLGFGVLILFLVNEARNDRTKWNKKFDAMLRRRNFNPSPESGDYAEKSIKKMVQPNTALDVQKPNKAVFDDKEIYFSKMYIGGPETPTVIVSDAFLFPLNCTTDQHFIFFMKFDHYEGLTYDKDIVTSAYSLTGDFTPETLVELELPKRAELNDVLFAYGDKGSSLDSLYGSSLFNGITEAGKYGFFAFYYKEGMASLLTLERYEKRNVSGISWEKQWAYIQELMRLSAKN